MVDASKDGLVKKNSAGKIFSRVFWIVILLMLAINGVLYLVALTRDDGAAGDQVQTGLSIDSAITVAPVSYTVQSSTLRNLFSRAATATVTTLTNSDFISDRVDELYAPVYASVSKYADIHYTVAGGYSEMWAVTFGDPTEKMEEILFVGFDNRLNALVRDTDREFNAELERNFDSNLEQELPEGIDRSNITAISETIIKDTFDRIKISVPISAMASASGAFGVKVVTQKLSSQFIAKLAVKTGAKFAAKSAASVAGGVAAGAAAGAVLGPVGAAVGGAVAAIGIWLGVDKLFVEGAEFFYRDEFEAELRSMIDKSKADVISSLKAAVVEKGAQIENITLRELSN